MFDALLSAYSMWLLPCYTFLGSPAGGQLVFGVLFRALLLVAAVALASLAWQVRALAGSQGQAPAAATLRAVQRDFGSVRAALWWPTALWPLAWSPAWLADGGLVALPAAAAAAAVAGALLGGGWAHGGAAAALVALLSIDAVHALVYPWDSLLLEALWLAALALPPLPPAWEALAARAPPLPLAAFAFRLLSARLLLGFGALKFAGAGRGDHGYIGHFLIAQPIVSPLGVWAHGALPQWATRALLAGMFVVEVPLPLAALAAPAAWGGVRLLFVVATVGLMAGIQATGNFGYFNLLTAVLVLSHAYHGASLFDTSVTAHVLDSLPHAVLHALALLYFLPAIIFALPLNSWVNLAWTHWAGLRLLQPTWLLDTIPAALRALSQARAVAAYGVFPPHAFPGQRWVVQYEVRVAAPPPAPAPAASVAAPAAPAAAPWRSLHTHYQAQARAWVAPHHPRTDHALFYEAMGLTAYTPASALGHHSPYKGAGWASSDWVRLQLRVASAHLPGMLRRGADALALLAPAPDADAARAALQAALVGADVLAPPFWRPRDAQERPRTSTGRAPPRLDAPHADFAAWEYVCPLVQARALLKLQLPDHARGGAWRETVAGVHLPAVTALHLLRRRGTGGGAGAAPRWAVAQDEAFLALEAGAIDGPADFSPDAVHWRRAAVAPLPPTAEDEDLAWRVIAELRAAAGDEARRRAAAPPPQAPAPPPVPGSVAETVARTRTLVDTPVETLAAAAAAAAAAGATADAPLDAAAASVLFSYAQLPAVAVALRAAFSPLQLRRAERALNLLALPLLEVLEAACWRPPPPPEVLAAELASAGFDASDAWARWYARLPAMVAGAPAQPSGRPPTLGSTASQPAPTPQSTPPPSFTDARGETFAVLAFADNDDAGEAGCLRNAWRLGMHARWLLLVGGRRAYEAARAQPAPAAAAGVAARLRRLLPSAATSLGPQLMGSEAGTFVHAALHYETYAAHARRALSVGLLPRPPRDLPPASLAPLPGYIELLDRLAAHHASLRAWEPAGARLIDGIAAPAWGLDADDDWQLLAPPVECAAACYADDEGAGKD